MLPGIKGGFLLLFVFSIIDSIYRQVWPYTVIGGITYWRHLPIYRSGKSMGDSVRPLAMDRILCETGEAIGNNAKLTEL